MAAPDSDVRQRLNRYRTTATFENHKSKASTFQIVATYCKLGRRIIDICEG